MFFFQSIHSQHLSKKHLREKLFFLLFQIRTLKKHKLFTQCNKKKSYSLVIKIPSFFSIFLLLHSFSYFSLPFFITLIITPIISLDSFPSFSISLFYSFKIRLTLLIFHIQFMYRYIPLIILLPTIYCGNHFPFYLTGTLISLLTCN